MNITEQQLVVDLEQAEKELGIALGLLNKAVVYYGSDLPLDLKSEIEYLKKSIKKRKK